MFPFSEISYLKDLRYFPSKTLFFHSVVSYSQRLLTDDVI